MLPSAVVSWRRGLATIAVALAALVSLVLATSPTRADYQGPDENASQAFGPIKGAYTYSATLNQNGTSPDDQDWYYYYVPTAGDHLHWTIANTNSVSGCTPLGPYYCNVYATLEDSSGHQLGGSNSSAGTSAVGPGKTQTIDWTFQAPGKYYIAVVGDGNRIPYQFSVTPAGGVSASLTGTGGSGTPTLGLHAHQAGRKVDFSLTIPAGGGRLDALLSERSGGASSPVGAVHRARMTAGQARSAVRLGKRAWSELGRRHHLTFILRVTVTRPNGARLKASRTLTLRRR